MGLGRHRQWVSFGSRARARKKRAMTKKTLDVIRSSLAPGANFGSYQPTSHRESQISPGDPFGITRSCYLSHCYLICLQLGLSRARAILDCSRGTFKVTEYVPVYDRESRIYLPDRQRGRRQQIQHGSYSHLNLHQAQHKAMDPGVIPLQYFVLLGAILSSFVRTR